MALGLVCLAGCEDEPNIDQPCKDLEPGHACTWIGLRSGEGFNGDNLHRRETLLNQPQDLLFLPDGTAWFTDFNNFLVRRVLTDDTVESVVGLTNPIFPGDGPFSGLPPMGANGSDWLLNHPTNLLMQPDGKVLVVAWHNHKLLTVDPDTGFVTVVCGGGAGYAGDGMLAAESALFKQLNDASFDEAGNLYIVDQQNQRVRKIDTNGIITTIAGDGTSNSDGATNGDGGPAAMAQFSWAVGSNPNPSGGILYHEGMLYLSETEADVIRVIDLEAGTINRFAGTYEGGDSGDNGPAINAQLNGPRDLEIGPDGDLYFADTDNGKVRAINLETGMIRTVVGTGELGIEDTEGMLATEIKLRRPFGVAFDPDGNLYVMDTLNSRIVKVAR
ncbi:fibronectin type III domain protein [Enhygromyxa salina]|uniref:Fibronectin type III domain protein n=1 Tax=Enhygromyxa salina TaxID=215803 RepID=A0A0C2CTD3_9BACT|nr:fibronectin type III domain protein [Enhygromyxa salina]